MTFSRRVYPAGLIGNDDPVVGDEDNNPYAANVVNVGFVKFTPPVGKMGQVDDPKVALGDNGGNADDTVEFRFQFKEFCRIEIDRKWYRLSDDVPWRIHQRFKKIGDAAILTGPDGICHTQAQDDDTQRVNVGKGWPKAECIAAGADLLIQSAKAADDDYVVEPVVVTSGADGIGDTRDPRRRPEPVSAGRRQAPLCGYSDAHPQQPAAEAAVPKATEGREAGRRSRRRLG